MRLRKKKSNSGDNSDDEEEEERKRQIQCNLEIEHLKHRRRQNKYHNDHPSKKDLKNLADDLMRKVAAKNNDKPFVKEAKADTIAVGLRKGEIIISGNLKERRQPKSNDNPAEVIKVGKRKIKYADYGINEGLSKTILAEVKKNPVYKKSRLDVKIVEEKVNPRKNPQLPKTIDKANAHASKHAEMKIQAFTKQGGSKLRKMGISKAPCKGCHGKLKKSAVRMKPAPPGHKKVKNWKEVDKDDVEVKSRIKRSKTVDVGFHFYDNNVHLSKTKFKETTISNIKRSVKPGASAGLITGAMQLAKTLENGSVKPFVDGDTLNASSGCVPNALLGKSYFARASVAEVRAGLGDVASIGASALSAGVHAEYGWNNSVSANASVVRVDGNVGPLQIGAGLNFDSHASIGINGVSGSVLGMGFSIGPRIGIQTPILDLSFTLF